MEALEKVIKEHHQRSKDDFKYRQTGRILGGLLLLLCVPLSQITKYTIDQGKCFHGVGLVTGYVLAEGIGNLITGTHHYVSCKILSGTIKVTKNLKSYLDNPTNYLL
ncbi:hypothetical protein CL622_05195 [archaeon]|nr:hypothetical protein [archaeon]|tara:strand:- start:1023 stop:1343 length:321 start_codon:yes stop_codon:yes gene_type:complete